MKTLRLSFDIKLFLILLHSIRFKDKWTPYLWTPYGEKRGLIRLKLNGSEYQHSPLTAVYHYLTGKEVMNSFLVPEMGEYFKDQNGDRWYEILDISYATDACDVSRQYDRNLRNLLLEALGLPLDKNGNTD